MGTGIEFRVLLITAIQPGEIFNALSLPEGFGAIMAEIDCNHVVPGLAFLIENLKQ